jgi:hypothetical protein
VTAPRVGDRKVFTYARTGGVWTWEVMAVDGCVLTVRSDAGNGATYKISTDQWHVDSVTPGVVAALNAAYNGDVVGPAVPPAPAMPPPGPRPLSELSDGDLDALAVDPAAPAGRRMAARKILDARLRAR